VFISATFLLSTSFLAAQNKPAKIEIKQLACGAILKDNFNRGTIDLSVWRTMSLDPGIKVGIENAELVIRGTSAQISTEVLHKELAILCRYAGLYSRYFPQVDASLAVRVRMPSGISKEPGAHVVSVHLCGVQPDCYSEVLFGRMDGKIMEVTMQEYAKSQPQDSPWRDARGWWFSIINQDPGRYWYRVSGAPLQEQGNERDRFCDTLVEYDEPTRLSRGFVKIGESWAQLGEAETVIRGVSAIELKIMNVTPLSGAYREARFDDCRFYPNPRRHPVRFVLVNGGAPYGGPRLRVALCTADGTYRVSEGYTDQFGIVYLPVNDPAWRAFPVSARVRIFKGEYEIATGLIEAHDVEGLYPGDARSIDTSQINALK
jgi:hypothetical protein